MTHAHFHFKDTDILIELRITLRELWALQGYPLDNLAFMINRIELELSLRDDYLLELKEDTTG